MDIISRIVELIKQQKTHCLATIVESTDPGIPVGQKVIVLKDGSRVGNFSSSQMNDAIGEVALDAISDNEKRIVEIVSGVRVFLRPKQASTRDVGQFRCHLRQCGFELRPYIRELGFP